MKKRIVALLATLMLLLAALPCTAQAEIVKSQILYSGNTTLLPNDYIQLQGSGLAAATGAELIRVPDETAAFTEPTALEWSTRGARKTTIEQNTDNSLKCRIPSSMEKGIFILRMSGKQQERLLLINGPRVRWIQGDFGQTASPGGWLRLQGENLALDAKNVRVALKAADGHMLEYSAEAIDNYSIKVSLTENIAVGEYAAYVYNGRGDSSCWSAPVMITVQASVRTAWP